MVQLVQPSKGPAALLALSAAMNEGPVATAAFRPGRYSQAAHEPFAARLHLSATRMTLQPPDVRRHVDLGDDLALFPEIEVTLVGGEGRLRPLSSAPIAGFSKENQQGGSYWDVLIQDGSVWSEEEDEGWSRAAFPFALVNPLENETYNGLGLFAYRQGRVTPLLVQIIQQTAPFLIRDYFTATAVISMSAQPPAQSVVPEAAAVESLRPWPELEAAVGPEVLAGYDDALASPGLVASGIDLGGRFHLRSFDTPFGPWPYPETARLGVWSVTKSALAGLAALHLAARFGDTILAEKIVDHVPELAEVPAWQRVTFGHALCMATGVGSAAGPHAPQGMVDDALTADYRRWYLARSVAEKLAAIAADSEAEDWEPGTTFRYRDQDLFTVGIAMERFCAARCGRSLVEVLRQDVFAPLGLRDVAFATTIEAPGVGGSPLWAFGFYPTLGELARISRLLHAEGRQDGRQILSASLIRAIFAGGAGRGVVTDRSVEGQGVTYFLTYWCASFAMPDGGLVICPQMVGYGGNEVLLLPNGVTMIRIAKDTPEVAAARDCASMARIGMAIEGCAV